MLNLNQPIPWVKPNLPIWLKRNSLTCTWAQWLIVIVLMISLCMNSRTPTLRSVKSIGDNSQVLLPMLRTKDNVVLVGLSQPLVELKHTLLLKRVSIILILPNNNLLIVILKVLDVMVVIRILLLVGLLRTVSLHKINIHTYEILH